MRIWWLIVIGFTIAMQQSYSQTNFTMVEIDDYHITGQQVMADFDHDGFDDLLGRCESTYYDEICIQYNIDSIFFAPPVLWVSVPPMSWISVAPARAPPRLFRRATHPSARAPPPLFWVCVPPVFWNPGRALDRPQQRAQDRKTTETQGISIKDTGIGSEVRLLSDLCIANTPNSYCCVLPVLCRSSVLCVRSVRSTICPSVCTHFHARTGPLSFF